MRNYSFVSILRDSDIWLEQELEKKLSDSTETQVEKVAMIWLKEQKNEILFRDGKMGELLSVIEKEKQEELLKSLLELPYEWHRDLTEHILHKRLKRLSMYRGESDVKNYWYNDGIIPIIECLASRKDANNKITPIGDLNRYKLCIENYESDHRQWEGGNLEASGIWVRLDELNLTKELKEKIEKFKKQILEIIEQKKEWIINNLNDNVVQEFRKTASVKYGGDILWNKSFYNWVKSISDPDASSKKIEKEWKAIKNNKEISDDSKMFWIERCAHQESFVQSAFVKMLEELSERFPKWKDSQIESLMESVINLTFNNDEIRDNEKEEIKKIVFLLEKKKPRVFIERLKKEFEKTLEDAGLWGLNKTLKICNALNVAELNEKDVNDLNKAFQMWVVDTNWKNSSQEVFMLKEKIEKKLKTLDMKNQDRATLRL